MYRKILINEKIFWSSDKLLSWEDFQGVVDVTHKHQALSGTNLAHRTNFDPIQKSSKIKLRINWIKMDASFIPSRSWVRPQHKTNELLKHEQGHFDIAKLMAREIEEKLNQKFKGKMFSSNYLSLEEADKDPKHILTKLIKKETKIIEKHIVFSHDKYDAETNHGKIKEKQIEYDERFKKLRN